MINVVKPEVTTVGGTLGAVENIEQLGMGTDEESTSAEDLMEFAGRGCYQSFHKPNPGTRKNKDYLQNIINQGHESVLEHATVSFYVTGASRAFSHEMVRHRHFNYSQLSQRFVNEEDMNIVLPPAVEEGTEEAKGIQELARLAVETYKNLVIRLQKEQGLPRKQAREAARAVLPNCTETRMVVTGNHRAWREFLRRRLDPAADREIQAVAQLIFNELFYMYPALYEDIDAEFPVDND